MKGRVLAVDYGSKRTGLAVSDALGIAAHPLPAVVSEDLDETIEGVLAVVRDREVQRVLLGMPYLPSGMEGAAVDRVKHFLTSLKKKLPEGVDIVIQDERHTTNEAQRMLREAGLDRRKAKPLIDSTAAVVILREYLESQDDPGPPVE